MPKTGLPVGVKLWAPGNIFGNVSLFVPRHLESLTLTMYPYYRKIKPFQVPLHSRLMFWSGRSGSSSLLKRLFLQRTRRNHDREAELPHDPRVGVEHPWELRFRAHCWWRGGGEQQRWRHHHCQWRSVTWASGAIRNRFSSSNKAVSSSHPPLQML